MKHFIVKKIKELKEGDMFVTAYRGEQYRMMDFPPREKVKRIVKGGIETIINGSFLRDNHLDIHNGFVYMVEPYFNAGGRFEFKWLMGGV